MQQLVRVGKSAVLTDRDAPIGKDGPGHEWSFNQWNVPSSSLDTTPVVNPTRLAGTLMSQVAKRTDKLS